ncbi:MAG: DUF3284 domain-containing protein [Defluviitaleaceae bacterium]|nr:DUF3284 domain-containing protein [Defluviitaleaceae bacterium]
MTVSKNIKVTSDEFFELLENSLLNDIKSNVESFNKEDLKAGYIYEKKITNKLGKQIISKVEIEKFEKPLFYFAKFTTEKSINYLRYIVNQNGDYCEVTIEEEYKGLSSMSNLNFSIMNIFFKKSNKRRLSQMLKIMEEYIISKKS